MHQTGPRVVKTFGNDASRMARKTPHRKVAIKLPLEDWQCLDHLAAITRRSKNAILLEWLGPMIDRLPKRAGRTAAEAE